MQRTLKEYERLAYMSNLPKIAAMYARLDDTEQFQSDIDDLKREVSNLEEDLEDEQSRSESAEQKVENLERKLEKIAEIVNE